MEENMKFIKLAEKILEEKQEPLTPEVIWDIACKKGYIEQLKYRKGKTPWATIASQIYCDIRDFPNKTIFGKVDGKQIFYLKKYKDSLKEENMTNVSNKSSNLLEKDLHKYLTYYVYTNFKIYTKTISAQKALKNEKNADEWRYPDIVGVYYPEWEPDIVNVSQKIGEFGIKLFSYELKKELNSTNLRKTYFQAISNSSWANEGYLVALDITDDEEFLKEFKRLNSSFGIGLIKIDIEDPEESKIIFQSLQKENVDIDTMNILLKNNVDFKDLIKDITVDAGARDKMRGKYDEFIPVDELYK
jgi:hypothetical protein